MNWIFEVYGDTYSAILMQDRRPDGRLGAVVEAPTLTPILGALFGRR